MKTGAKGDTYYGKTARNYEKRRTKQEWWGVEQREMASLLDLLPDGLRVLDVPFGTGRFVPYYLKKSFTVQGLDASHEMLATAKDILGDDFAKCTTSTGTAMSLEFDDGAFDLVVSTRFIRDIIVASDAKKALAEFARVTRKYAIIQLGENTRDQSDPVDPNVVFGSRLSAADNAEMLASVGLKVVEKRLVKSDEKENSHIYHVLCEKAA
ncbi:class I SAM-dependent methyltransferase [Ruegeria profundi]|uniref:class I SAM-dependent methyltransferase n=1 Tax=Ruegeria profundi TaxID=1685378 RepID=UPI003C7BD95C